MFEITAFKLFNKGYGGMEVHVKTFYEARDGRKIVEPGTRKRSLPIGPSLRSKVDAVKYYFLILTNHWIPPYNDHFDKEAMAPKVPGEGEEYNGPWAMLAKIWDQTFIIGAKVDDEGHFIIKGFMEHLDKKKPFNMSTPKIAMTDDFGFYEEALAALNDIAKEMMVYFSEGNILANPREQLKGLAEYTDQDMNGLSDAEVEDQLIGMLEARGAIMISPTDAARLAAHKESEEPTKRGRPPKVEEKEVPPELIATAMKEDDPVEAPNEVAPPEPEPESVPKPAPMMEAPVPPPPPPAGGAIDMPTEVEPDPDIAQVVDGGTFDHNVPEAGGPELDHEGMAQGEYSGEEPSGNW